MESLDKNLPRGSDVCIFGPYFGATVQEGLGGMGLLEEAHRDIGVLRVKNRAQFPSCACSVSCSRLRRELLATILGACCLLLNCYISSVLYTSGTVSANHPL